MVLRTHEHLCSHDILHILPLSGDEDDKIQVIPTKSLAVVPSGDLESSRPETCDLNGPLLGSLGDAQIIKERESHLIPGPHGYQIPSRFSSSLYKMFFMTCTHVHTYCKPSLDYLQYLI